MEEAVKEMEEEPGSFSPELLHDYEGEEGLDPEADKAELERRWAAVLEEQQRRLQEADAGPGIVEDVQFCPFSVQEFCSVGDDSCLILWDARLGLDPTVKVEKAHNADLHYVDWNPHDDNLILTGSTDNSVRVFDCQNLTSGGVGSPVYKFEGHTASVLCVQWCPDKASIFGSSAEDGYLDIWDYEKVGKKKESVIKRISSSPPGMFFQHAGHKDKMVDFHWNTYDPWTIVSMMERIQVVEEHYRFGE